MLRFLTIILLVVICVSAVQPLAAANDIPVDAVRQGNLDAVKSWLANGGQVNAVQADGATALHWAVYAEREGIVDILIDAGADVTIANRAGVTPLILAAENGNAGIMRSLINTGADPNQRLPNGETVLMMAVRTGDPATVKFLIEQGADVDARETLRGTTALMWAAAYRNNEALALLLDAGADASAYSNETRPGRRPYLAPTARDRIDAYKLGIGQAGLSIPVNLEAVPENDQELNGLSPDVLRIYRNRLELQARREAGEIVDEEAEAEAENQRDPWGGITALVFAARENNLEGVQRILAAGVDVNQTTEFGWSALLTATQNRYYRLGSYLLNQGADPNIANKGGWTPLYIATDNRNIEGGDYPTRRPDMDHLNYIKLLLKHGADPNMRMASSTETRTIFTHQWLYEEGATPFLRAAQSSDLELMKLLLEHGADPHIATEHGVTPLMVAAGIGWVEGVTYEWSKEANLATIKLLLELGADVNAQDQVDLRTALMGAAHKGRNDIIELLVDHGADLSTHDIGSRDSLHKLAGMRWQALDYADGLVRVGVQSTIPHPETARLLRKLMLAEGLSVPPEGRTIDSICVVEICK